MKAVSLANIENHEEAIEIFDSILEKDPKNAPCWIQKGVSALALSGSDISRVNEYKNCFERALQITHHSVDTLFEIGLALFNTSQIKVSLNEEYYHVFGTSKDEGRVCKQCYNILSTLQHDCNLVSRLCESILTYIYIYLTFNYIIYIYINYCYDLLLNYFSQIVH
jgi:tetratricopeptide (TPR) repeat protein